MRNPGSLEKNVERTRPVVTRHADAAAFQSAAGDFLLAAEAENNLILGIVDGLLAGRDVTPGSVGAGGPPLLATVGHATIELAAVCTPPEKLVVSRGPTRAAELLARSLAADDIPGVRGEAATARAFAEAWSSETGQAVSEGGGSRVYELYAVQAPAPVSGRFREAAPEDIPLLAGWRDAFMEEARPGLPSAPGLGIVSAQVRDRRLYVWEDGEAVSMAATVADTPNGARIGLVYTPPEFRRRGYAGACVAALSQAVLRGGKAFCSLFTDLDNPTSNAIYQRIGYQPVADVGQYSFVPAG